jgi:glycosyltransferase involved in cell wall biosynthesis
MAFQQQLFHRPQTQTFGTVQPKIESEADPRSAKRKCLTVLLGCIFELPRPGSSNAKFILMTTVQPACTQLTVMRFSDLGILEIREMNKQLHPSLQDEANNSSKGSAPSQPLKGRVAILLCTYNGSAFLESQLESFAAQTHENWVIYASDDGSSDETLDILTDFQKKYGQDRLFAFEGPRQGFAKNFMSLVKNQTITADYFAFSDQDDIWLEDKLERSLAKLMGSPDSVPVLYCSRTRLIDANRRVIGFSPLFTSPPGFRNALVQSLAGANTMLINNAARDLLAETADDAHVVAHDWLTYLVVSGAGGKVIYDPTPTLDYRQHGGNLIGANSSLKDRLIRISKMFSGRFSDWSSQNIYILGNLRPKLTPENRLTLSDFEQARQSSLLRRLYLMRKSRVYRQTPQGNVSLIVAAFLNKI